MKALVTGWCPKHDRVFERADRCPECGTTLIPVGSVNEPAPPEEHREILGPDEEQAGTPAPARDPWRTRLFVGAAVAAAFILGLIFPRAAPETGSSGAPPAATRERTPVDRTAISGAGGSIRLESLTQSDDRVTAVFRTVSGFPDPHLIEDAAVGVTVATETSSGTPFGLSDVRLESSTQGFTITGRLDAPGDIVELRIESIQVREEHAPEWKADISSIWPAGGVEPRVLRVVGQSRAIADGTVRLTAMLAWKDRLEAVFELRGAGGAPGNRSQIAGLDMLVSPARSHRSRVGGVSIAASRTDQISAGQLIARFEAVPSDPGTIIIRATRLLVFVEGPWKWRLS